MLWRHRRAGIGHRRRRHRGGSHRRRRRRGRGRGRTRTRAVRCQSRSAWVRAWRTHGVATGRISLLSPNGRRKRERGDHRHTGQKMMFHVCDPLSRSSVGHGRTIRVAAVGSKSSPQRFRWCAKRRHQRLRSAASRGSVASSVARAKIPLLFTARRWSTTTRIVMFPSPQFSASHSARPIRMIQREARLGKRSSSLATDRITDKAKRMPQVTSEARW